MQVTKWLEKSPLKYSPIKYSPLTNIFYEKGDLPPVDTNFRITDDDVFRITDDGGNRITDTEI